MIQGLVQGECYGWAEVDTVLFQRLVQLQLLGSLMLLELTSFELLSLNPKPRYLITSTLPRQGYVAPDLLTSM